VSSPGPGDVVDDALKKCDAQEGKYMQEHFYTCFVDDGSCDQVFRLFQNCVTLLQSMKYLIWLSGLLFCSLILVLLSRALPPIHQGATSLHGPAPLVAMHPAVSKALPLGTSSPQTHQATPF